MKHVIYVGKNPTIPNGAKALMRDDGKVQLDGPNEGWRASERNDPRCYGWYDLGDEWVDVTTVEDVQCH